MDKDQEDKLNDLLEEALDDLLDDTKDGEDEDNPKPGDPDEQEMTEELNAELAQIDPQHSQQNLNPSVPPIFQLMQNLVSKELLYPPLMELILKFEQWHARHGRYLSKQDFERYDKQICLIHDIIDNFEDDDLSTEEKFERNLELLEQVQSLGPLPEELRVLDDENRCAIM